MKFSLRTQRLVGLSMVISHIATVLLPYQRVNAAPRSPGPNDNWVPPAVIKSKTARPNLPRFVTPPDLNVELPVRPTDERLREHRGLAVPLVRPKEVDVNDADREGAAQALNAYSASADRSTRERLKHLADFLGSNAKSPYAVALWLEVATRADATGDFKAAIAAANKSWDQSKSVDPLGSDRDMVSAAEESLSRLCMLYVRTARKQPCNRCLKKLRLVRRVRCLWLLWRKLELL